MSYCEARGISFSYGTRPILDEISFDLNRGEVIAFIGPSGCGKSTLLRCIAGLLKPQRGTIRIGNNEVFAPHKCSFMFQRPTLLPWLSVRENLTLPFKLQSRPLNERDVLDALDETHISNVAISLPANLSGGEAQRVAFARALLEQRTVILLDEPFSSLDEIRRRSLAALLSKTIYEKNLAGILVTHSIHDAVFIASKIYVLGTSPALIVGEFSVPLPMPRIEDLWMGEELVPFMRQVRNLLEVGNHHET